MIKINWVCFGNASGYAQAAQDAIFSLYKNKKYDIRVEFLFNLAIPRKGISSKRYKIFEELTKKPKTDDHIQIYHCIPTAQRQVRPLKYNIGFATFETYNPPNSGAVNWISILNKNDVIITPSMFNYKIFAHENIKKPLYYIPHCFDAELFNPDVEPAYKYDKFTFLFFGSWRERKGYSQLIEAWCKEFKSSDNVQLVIKTDKIAQAEATIKQLISKYGFIKEDIAPILFEKNIFDEETLPRFMKSFDCLISPTLGEGFGLPGLQCMALKVPVIITDFSGCQEYANEETATLLKPEGFIQHPCLDNLPQFRNKKWAFITVSEVRKAMRHAFSNYDEIKYKAGVGNEYVFNRFTYDKSEKYFSEMIGSTVNV